MFFRYPSKRENCEKGLHITAIISINQLKTIFDCLISSFILWKEESGGLFLFGFLLLSTLFGPQSCGQN